MNYKICINNDVYTVTGFRSYHVTDTPRARFSDVAQEEHPDRTLIEFDLPDGRVGVVPIPTPIADVIAYFQMLDEEGEVFRADDYYVLGSQSPKVDLHELLKVSPN